MPGHRLTGPIASIGAIAYSIGHRHSLLKLQSRASGVLQRIAVECRLRVISPTSAISLRDRRIPVSTIARELNVDAVIEGGVRQEGGRARISIQMIHAPTDPSLRTTRERPRPAGPLRRRARAAPAHEPRRVRRPSGEFLECGKGEGPFTRSALERPAGPCRRSPDPTLSIAMPESFLASLHVARYRLASKGQERGNAASRS